MGRWMEGLNKDNEVIVALAPNFLIYSSRAMPKKMKADFPRLTNLYITSNKWIDELQSFEGEELIALKFEIEKLENILSFKEYISGVDSERVLKNWISEEYQLQDILIDIEHLKSFFNQAINEKLEVKIYL